MKATIRLTLLTILLLACNLASPTVAPRPVCTPPPCQLDEVYYCPSECPGGCGTTCATPTPTAESLPEGLIEYDGCAFTVSYPPELIEDGSGWMVFFHAESTKEAYVSIQARRETGATAEAAADALVTQFTGHGGLPNYEPVTVTDHLGELLTGARAELSAGGEHFRLLLVVRPETLLGNMLPDDVVYEIVARAPEPDWSQWEAFFDIIFRTFQPRDCGGV